MKENRSVSRILQILDLIAKHDEGLTLGQIYRILDIPKATVYDFLQTLYKADAIYYKDPRLKNYVIGSKMFAIGSVYTKNSNLIEASQYELKEFAENHGRTVFITKRINDKIVYVFKFQPSNSKIVTPQEIGSVSRDFENGPIGQCYTIFDKALQNKDIPNYQQIKKDRYVFSSLDDSSHICTLAAPVFNFENRVCGVLVASDLATEDIKRGALGTEFAAIAERISRKLGYLGNFNE
ncbi:MAG: helix-turn-helix domain-containing protein [Acholeplasmataceae bacterium]|nr:helix-turn-helix domain-containing protein [Acholeplasmataceae bacterium]